MQRPKEFSEILSRPQGECDPRRRNVETSDTQESVAGAPANAVRTANDSGSVMGLSVTPHDPISNLEDSKFLSCGVDSLDLGLYVRWGDDWGKQTEELEIAKTSAAGTVGVPLNGGQCLVLPSGKRPSYRWHLQWAEFHIFLAVGREPQEDTPNVYASINSETLWRHGMEGAVALVVSEVETLGGEVLKIKPSRCDLAADFLIPGGVPHGLLLSLRVPSDCEHVHHMKGGSEETFYHGSKSSPVKLRIYDKALEVQRGGIKFWFLDVWKLATCEGVWRVEFQLRRPYLKAFGIDTVAILRRMMPALWTQLTENWFSLRLLDNDNVTRRTVHPWWLKVQCCDVRFGEPQPLVRSESQSPVDAEWFVSHGAGCLLSYAARQRLDTFESAANQYLREMAEYWNRKNFAEAYAVKSIQLGFVNLGQVGMEVA